MRREDNAFRFFFRKALCLLALAVLTAGPIFALTLSELRTDIRLRIKDTSSTRQRFSDTHLLTIINQGQRDVINTTWAISKSTTITLVAGTQYYTLPTDILQIQRVTNEYANLPEVTLQQQDTDNANTDWESDSDTPIYFFQNKARTTEVGIAPTPTAGGTLRIIYYATASSLSSDSDEPFNGEDRFNNYHDLLVHYTCGAVFLLEGEIAKAQSYHQLYETRLKTMRENIGTKPFMSSQIPVVDAQ